ncbi:MAG: hypothetical protein WCQ21_06135 [Verrucomicrobiota bacterium]|jgi:hypothetical protein
MTLPTEQDINPQGDHYDGQAAVDRFLGKTREQITKEWAEHGHYYCESLYYMGGRAFCFYFPAVVDYVTRAAIRDENEVASDLCDMVESRLKYDLLELQEAFPAIVRFADCVLTNYKNFGYDPAVDEGLWQRLMAIRQQSAELAGMSACELAEYCKVACRRVAEAQLEAACRLLPKPPDPAAEEFERLLKEYRVYMDRHELELALDRLQGLGDLVPCRGGYWRNLERAAETMELAGRMPYLRSRFEQTGRKPKH